ncbi:MAG: GNAT family N-acetyltransferase [Alphaproteobacteria bacterium]|nr:GNAT family N-acetyltransferase [Alphaproteobacteria bacterium]MCZ6849152.1 GNAT family N-acetyltransferase [Alphaproteobacteria bacterium]
MKALSHPDGIAVIAASGVHGPAIARLHKCCFDEAWSIFTVRQVLAMPGAFGLLAVEEGGPRTGGVSGGDLLGFALGRSAAGECELLSLAVTIGERGRGIGGALLAAAMDRARRDQVSRLFLEVAEDNAIARRLYRNFGFRPVGRRPRYYRRPQGVAAAALTYSVSLED